jgi:hypothetical protein
MHLKGITNSQSSFQLCQKFFFLPFDRGATQIFHTKQVIRKRYYSINAKLYLAHSKRDESQ